jgi:Holliday junction resolvasome RuvABC endonuclease subunit
MGKSNEVVRGKKEEIINHKKLTDPIFVGMDPSYNGFAIILIDKDANIIEQKLIESDTKLEAEDRIIQLEKEFKFIANIRQLKNLYIEGPSYASKGAFVLQMGALHFYIRIFFRKKDINYKIITPGTLKKFVAGKGKGNAKKELMLLKTYKKWGVEFDDNNLCDAYGLARLALEDYQNE